MVFPVPKNGYRDPPEVNDNPVGKAPDFFAEGRKTGARRALIFVTPADKISAGTFENPM